MIDHISVRVQDFPRAVEFYKAALAPLGYQLLMQFEGGAGLGVGGMPDLWIMQTDKPINPTHVAIAGARGDIQAFHEAALAAGGTDNGAPGLRVDYHPHYYAGFVLDPEGNNLEVVCHEPEGVTRSASRRAPAKKAAKSQAKKTPAKKTAAKPAKKSAAKPAAKSAKTTAGKAPGKKSGKAAGKKRR